MILIDLNNGKMRWKTNNPTLHLETIRRSFVENFQSRLTLSLLFEMQQDLKALSILVD